MAFLGKGGALGKWSTRMMWVGGILLALTLLVSWCIGAPIDPPWK